MLMNHFVWKKIYLCLYGESWHVLHSHTLEFYDVFQQRAGHKMYFLCPTVFSIGHMQLVLYSIAGHDWKSIQVYVCKAAERSSFKIITVNFYFSAMWVICAAHPGSRIQKKKIYAQRKYHVWCLEGDEEPDTHCYTISWVFGLCRFWYLWCEYHVWTSPIVHEELLHLTFHMRYSDRLTC